MGTISARVSEDVEAELEAYLDAEGVDRSTAVRALLADALEEWRHRHAVEELAEGRVSFARAAELAGLSVWDFAALAREHDVTWVSGDHLADDLDALDEAAGSRSDDGPPETDEDD